MRGKGVGGEMGRGRTEHDCALNNEQLVFLISSFYACKLMMDIVLEHGRERLQRVSKQLFRDVTFRLSLKGGLDNWLSLRRNCVAKGCTISHAGPRIIRSTVSLSTRYAASCEPLHEESNSDGVLVP